MIRRRASILLALFVMLVAPALSGCGDSTPEAEPVPDLDIPAPEEPKGKTP